MTDAIVILSTVPNEEKAAEIARALVEDHLVACVNIVPGLRSIFRWEGKLSDDAEVLCIIKTARDRFDQVAARIKQLHPYSVPEVIALPVVKGFEPYLEWVRKST
jgi:periplasmic divalent cation tolerance protein